MRLELIEKGFREPAHKPPVTDTATSHGQCYQDRADGEWNYFALRFIDQVPLSLPRTQLPLSWL